MAVRDDFAPGEVLAAADLNDTFASKLDAASQSIVQVKSVSKTDTFTHSSTTYTDITGLTLTITPTSATNKILCFMAVQGSQDVNVNRIHLRFARGGTGIGVGDAAGSRTQATASMA